MIFLLLAALPATAGKVTIDDLMRLRSVNDVRISPDGKRVAYVISTPSFESASHEAVLYLVPSSGGTPHRLTYATKIFNVPLPAPMLRWSPDGSVISFLGTVEGVPQVLAISMSGGEAYPITSLKQGVAGYEWSPDGKKIAFMARDPATPEEEKRKKEKSFFTEVDRQNSAPRLWVHDIASGAAKPLSPITQAVLDFGWASDSSLLAYSASEEPGFNAQYRSSLYTIAVSGGEPKVLLSRPGMNRTPRYSPDGKWLAFISSAGEPGMVCAKDLFVMPVGGDLAKSKSLTREAWVLDVVWSPDSRSIVFTSNEPPPESGSQMFEGPIMRAWLEGGRIEQITPSPLVSFQPSLSADGTRIAYKAVDVRTAGDVYVANLGDRKPQRIVEVNPQLKQLELGELRAVSWKSFDGAVIWGLLLTPPGHKPGTKLPLIVYCHGGPIGGFSYGIFPQFAHVPGQVDPYPVEAMASAGVAILFPMPRGGSGYGIKGFRTIMKSWGDVDYKDIMAGVDAMVAQGIGDPDRLGVMGASYGGFMTNWIVTQTGRFKAASAGCSLSNLIQMYYHSDGGDFMVEYFGLPWEATDDLLKHSPITHVARVTTPLLIQHGEHDYRVPVGQAREFYKALKTLKKTVEFDIYPRGGHVNFEPPLEREYWRRNMQWFTRWLNLQSQN